MSGGVAYVYDPDEVFEDNLNAEMVDLEALTDDDFDLAAATIERHTSTRRIRRLAQRILADWSQQVNHFAKVMPRDYKKVLVAIAEAEKQDRQGRGRGDHGGRSWLIQAAS